MTGAYWAQPLTEADLDLRLSGLVASMDDWGTVRYATDQPRQGIRESRIEVRVSAFGVPSARFIYSEVYIATARGWVLAEYFYNLLDERDRRFLGYHHHPITALAGPDTSITHAHCRPLDQVDPAHYRAIWVDLWEAHWEFVRCVADPAQYPDCGALSPLVPAASSS